MEKTLLSVKKNPSRKRNRRMRAWNSVLRWQSFTFEESNPLDRMIEGKKCRFIEIIIAAYKMKTSSLTRYLWLLMILFIPISTESIYNRTFNRETSHIRTMLWTEDTITSTLKTWHSTCAHLICLPIEYCSSQKIIMLLHICVYHGIFSLFSIRTYLFYDYCAVVFKNFMNSSVKLLGFCAHFELI